MSFKIRSFLVAAILVCIGFVGMGCSQSIRGQSDLSHMYRTRCPYCGWDGYWPLKGLREHNGRATCSNSCGQVFLAWQTPETLLAQSNLRKATCPYCGKAGQWEDAELRRFSGRAYCTDGCGRIFQTYESPPQNTTATATNSDVTSIAGSSSNSIPQQTNYGTWSPSPNYNYSFPPIGPGVAENGSYYGQLNSYGVPKTVPVRGYYRKDGTYVRGHYRSRPSR